MSAELARVYTAVSTIAARGVRLLQRLTLPGQTIVLDPAQSATNRRIAGALARLGKQPVDWLARFITVAPFVGLRRGEVCDLRVREVRVDENGDVWLYVGKGKNGNPVHKRLLGEAKRVVEMRIERREPGAYQFPGPLDGRASRCRPTEVRQRSAYHSVEKYLRIVMEKSGQRHPEWGLRWSVKGGGVTPRERASC
jgi:integrase